MDRSHWHPKLDAPLSLTWADIYSRPSYVVPAMSYPNLPNLIFSTVMASGRSLAVVSRQEVDDLLVVHGVKIARITEMSSSSAERSHTDSQILAICHSWMPPNSILTSYLNGSSIQDAFLDTLTCGEVWSALSGGWPEKLKAYVQEFGLNGRNETMNIKYHPIAYTL